MTATVVMTSAALFKKKRAPRQSPDSSSVHTALLNARNAEDDKELDAAATECRQMKRPKHQPFARLQHPEASSTITSAPLAPAPLGTTPPPSPHIPDTGRSRSPAPGRPRPIGVHPGPPLSEPSSSAGAPSSSTIPPLTVYAGSEQGSGKGKPSQVNMGTGKGPSKSSKGDTSPPSSRYSFFHRCTTKR